MSQHVMPLFGHRFTLYYFVLPSLFYFGITLIIYLMNWDYDLSLYFYDLQGSHWSLKKAFLTETVIHRYGKYFSIIVYVFIIILYILSLYQHSISSAPVKNRLLACKQGLLYLVVSTLIATLSISMLKHLTHIDCPWSMRGLGGTSEYFPWLNVLFSSHNEKGQCFPAGHASAAYAFFSLYFFSLCYVRKKALFVLMMVIFFGVLFGLSQQLRGAHFISHDITTAYLCWMINAVFYVFMLKEKTIRMDAWL